MNRNNVVPFDPWFRSALARRGALDKSPTLLTDALEIDCVRCAAVGGSGAGGPLRRARGCLLRLRRHDPAPRMRVGGRIQVARLLWTVAIVLTMLWLLLFSAFRVAAWPVHLLLAAALLAA